MSNQKIPYPDVDMQAIHPEDKPDLMLAYIIKHWNAFPEESQTKLRAMTEKFAQEGQEENQAWLEKIVVARKTQIHHMTKHVTDARALVNYVVHIRLQLSDFWGYELFGQKNIGVIGCVYGNPNPNRKHN